MRYELRHDGSVLRHDDSGTAWIPNDPGNADYQAYQTWAQSNEPTVLPEPSPDPTRAISATLIERLTSAIQGNQDYLALATPTAAQTAAQVRALTRQVNALTRLTTGRLETAD